MKELALFRRKAFYDGRGSFMELYGESDEIYGTFVQDNISVSQAGVIRGLHIQEPNNQSKLVSVICGKVMDVVVDLRDPKDSQFGRVHIVELVPELSFFVPMGFAHGFIALEDSVFHYKCGDHYNPNGQITIDPFDKALNIDWVGLLGSEKFIMSDKDRAGISLSQYKKTYR